jgi:hypothetical protein|nr:MAG TPA: hypothetical protein [Bacteriophage sp.]
MTTITYNISIVGKRHSAEFQQATDSRNAVVAVDTSPLNGSLIEIEHKSQGDRLRFVRLESKSISGIAIRSSSPDILITDVIHEGSPMWFKYQLRGEPSIEQKAKWTKDENWIYSSSPYLNIQYGNIKIREVGIPVFVKESNHFFNAIKAIDNRTYSVSQDSSGEYIIRCKNQNVSFSSIQGEIATVSEYTNPSSPTVGIFANEYSSDRIASVGEVKAKYRFQSPEFVASIIKTNKVKVPVNSGVAKLPHRYINLAKGYDHKKVVYNQGLVIVDGDIHSLEVEYEYIEPVNNFASIPLDIIRASSVVRVYATPYSVTKGDAEDFLNTELLFSAFDKTGVCIYSTMSDVNTSVPAAVSVTQAGAAALKYNAGKGVKSSKAPRTIFVSSPELERDTVLEVAEIRVKDINLDYAISGRRAIPSSGSAGIRDLKLPKLSYSRIVLTDVKPQSINSNVTVIDANLSVGYPILIRETDTDILVEIEDKKEETDVDFVNDDDGRFHRRNPPVFLGNNSKVCIVNTYNSHREILKELAVKRLDGKTYIQAKKSDYPIGRLTAEYVHLSKIPKG